MTQPVAPFTNVWLTGQQTNTLALIPDYGIPVPGELVPLTNAVAALGGVTALVWQPNAPAPVAGNVYATWQALLAAGNALPGKKLVMVDTTFGAATVPAPPSGSWNLSQDWIWYGHSSTPGSPTLVTFAAGNSLAMTRFELHDITWQFNGTVITVGPASLIGHLYNATIKGTAAQAGGPLTLNNAGAFLQLFLNEGSVAGDNSNNVVTVTNGSAQVVVLTESGTTLHSFATAVASGITFLYDASSTVSRTVDGAGTSVFTPSSRVIAQAVAVDQSVSNSVALVNTLLAFTPQTGDVWTFTCELFFTFVAASGVTVALSLPGGSTLIQMMATMIATTGNTVTSGENTTGASITLTAAAGTSGIVRVTGSFKAGAATAATLQFTQQASNATATVLKAGSTAQFQQASTA